MTTGDNNRSLGICLSGGGFRASFYALGVLRYLAEAGHLIRTQVISAVSGGSIAAAVIADRWTAFKDAGGGVDAFLEKIDQPFRDRVTTKNIRNAWVRRAMLDAFKPGSGGRGAALGRTLAKELFEHEHVAELPVCPQVIFTSTDLGTGRAFRISRDFVGSYDYRYAEPAPAWLELGGAVAASASFPMSFSIVWLSTKGMGLTNPPKVVSLVDGGVYDNLGLEWFQGPAASRPTSALSPDFKIVVNASGLLEHSTRKYGALRAIGRDLSVQYAQSVNLRTRWFIDQLTSPTPEEQGVYVGIGRDPRGRADEPVHAVDSEIPEGALASELVEPLALLRTDLDLFLPEEADLLSYHGYWSLHARLREIAPPMAVMTPAWNVPSYANPTPQELERLIDLLKAGAKRKLQRRAS